MTGTWSTNQLELFNSAKELHIATYRANGTLRGETPIWVVRVNGEVYIRTYERRETGWFGHAVASGRAHVRVPGLDADVVVEDIVDKVGVRADIDSAYRAKYFWWYRRRLTSNAAADTTLRLQPAGGAVNRHAQS